MKPIWPSPLSRGQFPPTIVYSLLTTVPMHETVSMSTTGRQQEVGRMDAKELQQDILRHLDEIREGVLLIENESILRGILRDIRPASDDLFEMLWKEED